MRSTHSRCTLFTLFIFFTLLSLLPLARAAINITVDDQNGDESTNAMPIYSPTSVWNQGASCSSCSVYLDASSAYDNTWHDATFSPGSDPCTIQINFTGSAVYAYFILVGQQDQTTTLTNLSFVLDGINAGSLVHQPLADAAIQYNVLGFSKQDLENSAHTLVVSTADPTEQSLVLFDRLVYTKEDTDLAASLSTVVASPGLNTLSSTIGMRSVSNVAVLAQASTSITNTLTSLNYPSSATQSPVVSTVSDTSTSASSWNAAVIGGSVAGAVSVLSILAIILLCRLRRRRNKVPDIIVEPFTTQLARGLPNRPAEGFPSVISIRRSSTPFQESDKDKINSLFVESASLENGEKLAMPKPAFSLPTLNARMLVDRKVDPFRRRKQAFPSPLPPLPDRTESLLAFPSTSVYNTGHVTRRPKLSVIVPSTDCKRETIRTLIERDNHGPIRPLPTSPQPHLVLIPSDNSLPSTWMAGKEKRRPLAEWLVQREQALLDQIATLQAIQDEVEKLQDMPKQKSGLDKASILAAYHEDSDDTLSRRSS